MKSKATKESSIGLAILAAGASRRLGEPKQLIHFQGKPLLQHMIDVGSEIAFSRRWIILGAHQNIINGNVDLRSFDHLINKEWEEGMASSIRIAADQAARENLDALLLVLSDQPFVNSGLLIELIRLYQPNERLIMASEYNTTLGVPALFDRAYYEELMKLSGDAGARKLINVFRAKVKSVKFERGALDIDTPEDLKKLKSLENANNN